MGRQTAPSLITAPRVEGTVRVAPRRRLSFAEFGPEHGRPVLWLHGTPGARRQIPEAARLAAAEHGMRIVGIDRPGVGRSTPHLYGRIVDFVDDLRIVLDELNIAERFAVIGLSGGGPYALATAARLADRVVAAAILGGVAPTRGEDAAEGGIVDLARRFRGPLTTFRFPLGMAVSAFVWALRPVGSPGLELYARISPEGDRRLLNRPEFKAMFLDDIMGNSRNGLRAPIYDAALFGRHWGFHLRDVKVPVRWWHGDADHIIPLAHGRHVVERLPDATLTLMPGESHLGGLGLAEDVIETLLELWD